MTPRVVGRVRPFPKDRPNLVLLAGYAEYLSRLPLNLLAYGDPGAPHGAAYQWLDGNHDGRFQTLDEVIQHYDLHLNLGLSPQEKKELVEFVKSL